jgi:hypothetical protein
LGLVTRFYCLPNQAAFSPLSPLAVPLLLKLMRRELDECRSTALSTDRADYEDPPGSD